MNYFKKILKLLRFHKISVNRIHNSIFEKKIKLRAQKYKRS